MGGLNVGFGGLSVRFGCLSVRFGCLNVRFGCLSVGLGWGWGRPARGLLGGAAAAVFAGG
ncbi:hypothetical protein GCM10027199_13760 [Amycolatopsis magusensis]